MSPTARIAVAVAAVAILLFAVAFWFGPRSCDGGLEIYFLIGVGALVVLSTLPFLFRSADWIVVRIASAVGLIALGVGIWVAGLAAADFRIMCRLF